MLGTLGRNLVFWWPCPALIEIFSYQNVSEIYFAALCSAIRNILSIPALQAALLHPVVFPEVHPSGDMLVFVLLWISHLFSGRSEHCSLVQPSYFPSS